MPLPAALAPRLAHLTSLLVVAGALACSPDPAKDSGAPIDTAADTADTATDTANDTGDTATDTSDTATDTGTSDVRELPDGTCRTWEDCEDAEMCVDEETPTCGACMSAVRDCETARDCTEGSVCREYTPTCSCGDGPSSTCVPACDDDLDCGEGEQCDLPTGECVPWSCTDGYTCPAQHDCTPGAGDTDCVRRACSTDAGCDGDGWCVNGACFETVGVCELPRA